MNPLQMMIQMRNTGRDPMTIVRQMAGQDPRMSQFMQMTAGKSPQELEQLARNVAKERGTTIEEVARNIGLDIPSIR